ALTGEAVVTIAPQIMDQMLQTEARKLKQLKLLMDVVQDPEVRRTYYYQWYSSAQECATELQKDLVSGPIPDTQLIKLSLSAKFKQEAKLIVDKIEDRYMNTYVNQSNEDTRQRAEALRTTLASLQAQLDDKEKEIADFRNRSDVGSMETER